MFDKDLDKKVKQIYEASIEILENVGYAFLDDFALDVMRENGIKVVGKRAYFTEEQVKKYLDMVPSNFYIHGRDEEKTIHVTTESRHVTPSYGPPKVRNFDGTLRLTTLDDFINIAEVVQASDLFGMNGGLLVQPNEVDVDLSYPLMMYASIIKSDKPLYGLPNNYKIVKQLIDLMAITFGGEDKLKEKVRMMTLINPIDLNLDPNSVDTMRLACEYNQALMILPGVVGGATGPITLAGVFAINHASCLATIAFAQMLKPGTPIVYASADTTMDMSSGFSACGGPEYACNAKYGVALAKYHNIPARSTGGQCDASGVTAQTGYEAMLNMYEAYNGGTNIIMQGTGILDSFGTFSYEKMMVDMEMHSILQHYFKGLEVNEKTLAVDVIKEVVEKGESFLTHKHTFKNFRKALWMPTISIRQKSALKDTPNNLIKERCENKFEKLQSAYKKPYIDEKVEQELNEYMMNLGLDKEIIEKVTKK